MKVSRKDLRVNCTLYIPTHTLQSLTNPSVLPLHEITHVNSDQTRASYHKSDRSYKSLSLDLTNIRNQNADSGNSIELDQDSVQLS
jgi:hypothetical protein